MLFSLVVLGVRAAQRRHLEDRILSTWPETAALDPELVRFAGSLAAPALASHCAGCHGGDLHGDPTHGAPDLIDGEWLYGEGRVADIEQPISHGIRSGDHRSRDLADMPGFVLQNPYRRYRIASLKPSEIRDLAAFILQMNGRLPADSAAAGLVCGLWQVPHHNFPALWRAHILRASCSTWLTTLMFLPSGRAATYVVKTSSARCPA